MLNQLQSFHKEFFTKLVAERYPIKNCIDTLYETYPDIHKYAPDVYYRYLKSEEGMELVDKETERIREEAKTASYASRGSRVHSLVEIAEKLLQKLRSYSQAQVGSKEYISVSTEFRNCLSNIKSEVEILGIGDSSALDIFTSFAQMLERDKGIPDFVKRSLKQSEVEN